MEIIDVKGLPKPVIEVLENLIDVIRQELKDGQPQTFLGDPDKRRERE